jgi:hypothetical protein
MAVQTQIQVRRGTASSWTSTNPTLAAGELGFETDTGKFKIGTGAATWTSLTYAGGGQNTLTTYQYTATSGQTTFSGVDSNGNTLSYTVGNIQVYLNGVLLVNTAEYTATNGTSIVLGTGAVTGDSLTVTSLGAFTVSSDIPKSTLTAKGSIVTATAGSTPANLSVGANGTVLTADSAETSGLKWATPASGGMTLISTTTLSGASVTLSSIPQTYNRLYLVIQSYKPANDNATLKMRFNSSSTASTYYNLEYSTAGDFGGNGRTYDDTSLDLALNQDSTIGEGLFTLEIPDYANASTRKWVKMDCIAIYDTSTLAAFGGIGAWKDTSAVSSLYFFPGSGNFTSGTILLYGVS